MRLWAWSKRCIPCRKAPSNLLAYLSQAKTQRGKLTLLWTPRRANSASLKILWSLQPKKHSSCHCSLITLSYTKGLRSSSRTPPCSWATTTSMSRGKKATASSRAVTSSSCSRRARRDNSLTMSTRSWATGWRESRAIWSRAQVQGRRNKAKRGAASIISRCRGREVPSARPRMLSRPPPSCTLSRHLIESPRRTRSEVQLIPKIGPHPWSLPLPRTFPPKRESCAWR